MFALVSSQVQEEFDNVQDDNRGLRRRLNQLHNQTRNILEENGNLQARLEEKNKEISSLKERLGIAEQENKDLIDVKLTEEMIEERKPRFSLLEIRHLIFERNDLKARMNEIEEELTLLRKKYQKRVAQRNAASKIKLEPESQSNATPASHNQNQVDGNPKADGPSEVTSLPQVEEEEDGELPVQGPIMQEPEEKIYGRRPSRIVRL